MPTKDKSGGFWLNLTNFFNGLWGIFQHAIFSFVPGAGNRIIYVSGQKVDTGSRVHIDQYIGALYLVCNEVETFSRAHPKEAKILKSSIYKRASKASLTKCRFKCPGIHSLELNVLHPLIRANFDGKRTDSLINKYRLSEGTTDEDTQLIDFGDGRPGIDGMSDDPESLSGR